MAYRLVRVVLRLWLWLFFPRLRVLNQERLEQPGAVILLITHPRSWTAALLLISATERRVHCLLPSTEFRGFFRKLASRVLGFQSFDFATEEQDSWLDPCLNILTNQEAIALFSGETRQEGSNRASVADFAARLAVEAMLQAQEQLQPIIYPVRWLLGSDRRSLASLTCIDGPIEAKDFLPKIGEDLTEASRQLVGAVRNAMDSNIFGLAEPELEHFNTELESLSREHLSLLWSQRPDWKQRPEDLQLSGIARRWVAEQNRTDAARLVELRESLETYLEVRRQCSMEEFIVETAGPWKSSTARLVGAWLETVLGLPVALYGLINHLPAVIIFSVSGLLKSSPTRDPKVEWLFRISIVLSSYTAQVFFVHFWWGRAAAGYYALTLPVAGAYLWRYRWLVRHRIHVLIRKILHPGRIARAARDRENILARFDMELENSVRSLTVSNATSPDFAE